MVVRTMVVAGAVLLIAPSALVTTRSPAHHADADNALDEIAANDNREPAGVLRDGVLAIDLVAGRGTWYPEAKDGPGQDIHAFGEAGRGLTNPGPLIRVPVGTEIHATVRNAIAGAPLIVQGLHDRPGTPSTMTVPAGGTSTIRFRVTEPGTYFYWASTRAAPTLRDRWGDDSQLAGALIVDPPGAPANDHVFVLGIAEDSGAVVSQRALHAAVVNGRSWPHTPRHTLSVGDTARVRIINTTSRPHPMHLHGFYFRVTSSGTAARDTIYDAGAQRLAVTELVMPGNTTSMVWVPDRPGNWLLHCHMTEHMSPKLRRGPRPAHTGGEAHNHTLHAMSGLVTGWQVRPAAAAPPTVIDPAPDANRRSLRLLVQSAPARYGSDPALGFALQEGAAVPRIDSVVVPGPAIVLTRGEPVQIMVVNRLHEPTSIHWHGMELESYFDGVSGWSGVDGSVAPHVAPGDSFAVRFTPPRAGTFIYHSHFEEEHQLSSGMYGPLIVLEPGARYDPATDRSWVLGQGGPAPGQRILLNGSAQPALPFEAGRRYRVRLINIHPNMPLVVSVLSDSVPARWRAIAKDGADLPVAQARMKPAVQRIGVGETYDFEFAPEAPGELRLRATDPNGSIRLSGIVRVRAPGPR